MSKRWKRVVDNKMRSFGETNLGKRIIRINKKMHKDKSPRFGISKKDITVINTIVHEEMHSKHPKMHEKTVRKLTRKKVAKLSRKHKKKLYSLYK